MGEEREGKEPRVRDMPYILRYHGRWRAVVCMLLPLISIIAACAPPQPPVPTPTATMLAVPPATSTPLTDLPRLPLPAAESVIPSPDGTRLVTLDSAGTTLTLYDLAGTVYGQYHDPAGGRVAASWLADSSGVFITGSDHSARMMDRAGTVHLTAFDAISGPLLSPDGQWIAGTHGSSTGTQDVVEIGPRSGAFVHRLAPGSDFLGWLDGQVAYASNGAIYIASPAGGSAHLITSVPAQNAPREVPSATDNGDMVSSPDDQVLIVQVHDFLQMLTNAGLTQLPIHVIQTLSALWVGPHAALGAVGTNGAIEVIDMLTGAIIQKTPAQLAGNQPEAVSGSWIAATALYDRPVQLLAINYQTGASRDLGNLPPASTVVPLGPNGRFLVYSLNGPSYVANTA